MSTPLVQVVGFRAPESGVKRGIIPANDAVVGFSVSWTGPEVF